MKNGKGIDGRKNNGGAHLKARPPVADFGKAIQVLKARLPAEASLDTIIQRAQVAHDKGEDLICRRVFKYAGVELEIGDPVRLAGGLFDQKLIKGGYVVSVDHWQAMIFANAARESLALITDAKAKADGLAGELLQLKNAVAGKTVELEQAQKSLDVLVKAVK